MLKSLGFLISEEDKRKAEAMIETFCSQSFQQFLGLQTRTRKAQ